MEIKDVLIIVGALWAVHITVISLNFKKPFKIYSNLLSSWTGSNKTSKILDVDGKSYIRFSLSDYKDVPKIFCIVRFHYNTFKIILITASILFLLFICLGIFTAIIVWQVLSSTSTQIPENSAKILISGHILVFFATISVSPFFRYFENLYMDHIYIINDKGERVKKKIEKDNEQ